MFYLTSRAFKM